MEGKPMLGLIRASGLIAALALADPALAEQLSKHVGKISRAAPPEASVQGGFYKWCGARFGCYTGIPLKCTADTRPYQNIAAHQCYCLHDGCP
jgi:hypothetical protein